MTKQPTQEDLEALQKCFEQPIPLDMEKFRASIKERAQIIANTPTDVVNRVMGTDNTDKDRKATLDVIARGTELAEAVLHTLIKQNELHEVTYNDYLSMLRVLFLGMAACPGSLTLLMQRHACEEALLLMQVMMLMKSMTGDTKDLPEGLRPTPLNPEG